MMSFRRLICIIVLAVYPSLVCGAEVHLVPFLSAKGLYNSNIYFKNIDVREDFITVISPGIKLQDRTERMTLDLSGQIHRVDYMRYGEFSTFDQAYQGRMQYKVTPLLGMTAAGSFIRDSQAERNDVTSGQSVPTTDIFLESVRRDRANAMWAADYQASEKLNVSGSYEFNKNDYDSNRYVNDRAHNIGAGINYDLSRYAERVKGKLNVNYTNYVYSDCRTDYMSAMAGFSRDWTEKWNVEVEGGVSHTWFEQSANGVSRKNESWNAVGNVSLNYKDDHTTGKLTYSHDIRPASGLNGAAQRDALTMSVTRRMTYELYVSLRAGFYAYKSDALEYAAQAINQKTYSLGPRVYYELTKDMAFEVSYDYVSVNNDVTNTNTNRSLFAIRLIFEHPVTVNLFH